MGGGSPLPRLNPTNFWPASPATKNPLAKSEWCEGDGGGGSKPVEGGRCAAMARASPPYNRPAARNAQRNMLLCTATDLRGNPHHPGSLSQVPVEWSGADQAERCPAAATTGVPLCLHSTPYCSRPKHEPAGSCAADACKFPGMFTC